MKKRLVSNVAFGCSGQFVYTAVLLYVWAALVLRSRTHSNKPRKTLLYIIIYIYCITSVFKKIQYATLMYLIYSNP